MDKQELIDRLNGNYPDFTQKPRQHKVQREGGLQMACVRWFRLQYPAFAKLLFHPKNEADGAQGKKIAINAAAGVVPGVPDLILALPSCKNKVDGATLEHPEMYHGLGVELKFGKTNHQTFHQKQFQGYWQCAGYRYELCRSLEDFIRVVKEYMGSADTTVWEKVCSFHSIDDDTEANKQLLKRITKSKK